ncbi:1-phosphatidylinositol-4,5-bisphosphate phosphodiesterase delta-3, partial [Chelonia mydas]
RMGSLPLLPAGLTDDEDIKVMLKGSFLWKIKSRRRKKERFYRLQEDGLTILSESCFKRARSKQISPQIFVLLNSPYVTCALLVLRHPEETQPIG